MKKIADDVAAELMAYLDGEINNRALTVDADGDEWEFDSALYRTSGPRTGELEMILQRGKQKRGISLRFTVTDEQKL